MTLIVTLIVTLSVTDKTDATLIVTHTTDATRNVQHSLVHRTWDMGQDGKRWLVKDNIVYWLAACDGECGAAQW